MEVPVKGNNFSKIVLFAQNPVPSKWEEYHFYTVGSYNQRMDSHTLKTGNNRNPGIMVMKKVRKATKNMVANHDLHVATPALELRFYDIRSEVIMGNDEKNSRFKHSNINKQNYPKTYLSSNELKNLPSPESIPNYI